VDKINVTEEKSRSSIKTERNLEVVIHWIEALAALPRSSSTTLGFLYRLKYVYILYKERLCTKHMLFALTDGIYF
jgi:hypothetical protein